MSEREGFKEGYQAGLDAAAKVCKDKEKTFVKDGYDSDHTHYNEACDDILDDITKLKKGYA